MSSDPPADDIESSEKKIKEWLNSDDNKAISNFSQLKDKVNNSFNTLNNLHISKTGVAPLQLGFNKHILKDIMPKVKLAKTDDEKTKIIKLALDEYANGQIFNNSLMNAKGGSKYKNKYLKLKKLKA